MRSLVRFAQCVTRNSRLMSVEAKKAGKTKRLTFRSITNGITFLSLRSPSSCRA